MSEFNPIMSYLPKMEKVDYIVPERIREACTFRGYTYEEAAEKCGIECIKFGLYANGHKDIPEQEIFKLMSGLRFPKGFWYQIKWYRG